MDLENSQQTKDTANPQPHSPEKERQIFDAFISYGRADSKGFAMKLYENLTAEGLQVWIDHNDIPLAVDFQEQINDGIARSDNFIFIISPHSVNSPYCGKEIKLAIEYRKRIIPLLHVEQISRETWQERHPQKTEEQWQDYQKQGLHSCYPNMHPVISKLNWIYFREILDDFSTSWQGLITLFYHHQDYVRQHTDLLLRGMKWERHHKQTKYLLVGEDKHQAQAWLKREFADEQPPCEPTDLHCEFICESIKNANNMMSEVFLCYATPDTDIMEKIRKMLMRHSITVWTNQTDIETGVEFEQEIRKGIEQSDNVIYLISTSALNSDYCQMEFNYGLECHKRIIPLLIEKKDSLPLPVQVSSLQFIDFTNGDEGEKFRYSFNKLMKAIHQDYEYYREHKILLNKAIKWQQQNYNTSLLLRGYNLSHAQAWLKIAQQRSQHKPTPLQEEYINCSLQQPPADSLDVFISYSRNDADFARQLNEALQELGKTTWFDQESIASGEDFQKEIYRGITISDNFVFIISPKSITSPYCGDEVQYAEKLNKRFITLLYRNISAQDLHPTLAKYQWINFQAEEGNFSASFNELIRCLDTDRDHVRNHTKWLQRSQEWQDHQKSQDLLLRGSEFILARQWLKKAEAEEKHPPLTQLQKDFIHLSGAAIEREKQRERQRAITLRVLLVLMSLAFIVAGGLGIGAVKQRNFVINLLKEQINVLSESSSAFINAYKEFDGLLLALRAGRLIKEEKRIANNETVDTVINSIQMGLQEVKEKNRLLGHNTSVESVVFSPNGEALASGGAGGKIIIWNLNGSKRRSFQGHDKLIWRVTFSPNGQFLGSASQDKTAKLWTLEGKLLKTFAQGHGEVTSIVFSPNGKIIATSHGDGSVILWNLQGEQIRIFQAHEAIVWRVKFSPDGQKLATASADKTVKLWNLQGQEIKTFKGHQDWVWDVDFSHDGTKIITSSGDKTVKLWNLEGKEIKTFKGHQDGVVSVSFSADDQIIASSSVDKTIKLWNLEGEEIQTLQGHQNWVWQVIFSPKSNLLASASKDSTIRLWNWEKDSLKHQKIVETGRVLDISFSPDSQVIAATVNERVNLGSIDGKNPKILKGHEGNVWGVSFSPEGQLLATASEDKTVKLWNREGELIKTLKGHQDKVWSVNFSPNGQSLASASSDGTIKIWNLQGENIKTFTVPKDEIYSVNFSPDGKLIVGVTSKGVIRLWPREGKDKDGKTFLGYSDSLFDVSFSPDGKMMATASADKTATLWNLKGEKLQVLKGHRDAVYRVRFSPDGKIIATASKDRTAKLWGVDGRLLATLNNHTSSVLGLSFSPDGQRLATAGGDKSIFIFELNTSQLNHLQQLSLDDLMKKGCDWVGDYLNYSEEVDKSDLSICPEQTKTRNVPADKY